MFPRVIRWSVQDISELGVLILGLLHLSELCIGHGGIQMHRFDSRCRQTSRLYSKAFLRKFVRVEKRETCLRRLLPEVVLLKPGRYDQVSFAMRSIQRVAVTVETLTLNTKPNWATSSSLTPLGIAQSPMVDDASQRRLFFLDFRFSDFVGNPVEGLTVARMRLGTRRTHGCESCRRRRVKVGC